MTVAAILKQKGHEVASVAPTSTVAAVVGTLASRRIGAVLVRDTSGQLLGILSERDVVSTLAEHGARTLEMTAAQLMTRELKTATPHTTVDQAMGMMTAGRFRHLPVLDEGQLVGVISIGDIVKAQISDQKQQVESLMAYVAGS